MSSQGSDFTATTDSSGYYSLQAQPATYRQLDIIGGGNNLSLNIPQDYTLRKNDFALTKDTTLDITIPAKRVSVHVQDSVGNSVSNVTFQTTPTSFINTAGVSIGGNITEAEAASDYGQSQPYPTSDASGNVILWLLPTDTNHTYSLLATPPSGTIYQPTTVSFLSIINDTTVTVTFSQSVTLSGHIYDPLGNPVINQVVSLAQGNFYKQVKTDINGNYSIQATNGSYELDITGGGNNASMDVPQDYILRETNYSLTQNTTLDITVPAKKITVHVQDQSGKAVGNVTLQTLPSSFVNDTGLTIGGGITNALGFSQYGGSEVGPATDSSGNVILWLLPNDVNHTYIFTATSPSTSIYAPFSLNNISLSSDQTEVISLQYNHSAPVTAAILATQNSDGTYSNPTTVTLSATAASGYTIANMYYTIDGGPQQTYISPFAVSGSGKHIITYWCVDNLAVFESSNTKTFTIASDQSPILNSLSKVTLTEGAIYSTSGSFTDPDSTSWTATVDYGDGSGANPLSLSGMNFSLFHLYKTPGTYTVTVSVTDNQGVIGQINTIVTVNGDTLTITGTYTSLAGWIIPLPTVTTPVTVITNVSNKSNKITGSTTFSGKVNGKTYTFSATSYQSLVISGATATLKGIGKINGGTYTFFMVTNGTNILRIRVTNSRGVVQYDTQKGAPDSAIPTTTLTSGSISIK